MFRSRAPHGLEIRRRLSGFQLYGPAAAAMLAAFLLDGVSPESLVRAILIGAVIAGATGLLRDFPYPLRLMPTSRMLVAVLPTTAAAVATALLAAVGVDPPEGIVPAILVAAVAAIVIEVGGGILATRHPLRIAVLGSAEFASAIQRELDAIGGHREVKMLGLLNPFGGSMPNGQDRHAWALRRVRSAVVEHEIELLVRGPGSAASRSGRDVYDNLAEGCLDLPVRMIDGNQLYEQLFGHVPIGTIDSAWFLFLMHPNFQGTSKGSKRLLDLVAASLAAPIVLPLIALGALAIKLDDGGPVFYRQIRSGEGGREFEILKLRTMETEGQDGDARWSGAGDPRITRAGRILRRLHIDELPQLFNVFLGDMTLVGPRPEQPQITAELERRFPHYSRRMAVKPGVTGWAQVRCGYAGSELGSGWKLCHDLYYLKHRSLLSDVLIMLETMIIAARDSHRPLRAPQPEFLYQQQGAAARALAASAPALTPISGLEHQEVPVGAQAGAPGAAAF